MGSDRDIDQMNELVHAADQGDQATRDQLIELAADKLRVMARSMLKQFPSVRRWEETDDVWQSATLRLWKSLENVELKSARHFYNLASLQIRRQLIDLARHYAGPQGFAKHHATPALREDGGQGVTEFAADDTHDAGILATWTELHQYVDKLPDDEREVFSLLWYQGLPQADIARLLSISVSTVKRRWQAARLKLHDLLESGGLSS